MRKIKFKRVFLVFVLIGFLIFIIMGFITFFQPKIITDDLLPNLVSLPYLQYSDETANISHQGVTYFSNESYKGYNFYEDNIMNMNGTVVYEFSPSTNVKIIFRNGSFISVETDGIPEENFWNSRLAYFYKNQSKKWEFNKTLHHDIALSPENTIISISKENISYNRRHVEFDLLSEFDVDTGSLVYEWSSYENRNIINKYYPNSVLDTTVGRQGDNTSYDHYHINYVQVIPKNDLEQNDTSFNEGNWLVSFQAISLMVILDKETKQIVWSFGPGVIDHQHAPQMLKNGNILLFDNGIDRGYSRVVEINPITKKIVWQFDKFNGQNFFSKKQGYVQRLPNGNTLITNSESGMVFEVTPNKKIVWVWYNPKIKNGKRKTVYRMIRYPSKDVELFLNNQTMSINVKN